MGLKEKTKTKVTLTHWNRKHTIKEDRCDLSLKDYQSLFESLINSIGFPYKIRVWIDEWDGEISEHYQLIKDIQDVIDSDNSGKSAEQRLQEIKSILLKYYNND